MSLQHLIRVGVMGRVGRFDSADATQYHRGAEVIVRTARGLELGEVLAPPSAEERREESDGLVLRPLSVEDRLIVSRLEKNRHEAFRLCSARLKELEAPVTLVDVEHLFDGSSLFFYFLGQVTPEVEELTVELAELYSTTVRFREFSDALLNGCGPGCGTAEAEGAGCGSTCSSCVVAGACGTRKR